MRRFFYYDDDPQPYKFRYSISTANVLINLLGMLTHFLIMRTFLRHSTFKKEICYRIMANLSMFEFSITVGYFALAIFTITQDTFHQILEDLFSGLTFSGMIGVYLCTTLIAFNRFAVLSDLPYLSSLQPRFYKIALAMIWTLCLSYEALLFTPLLGFWFCYDLGMTVMALDAPLTQNLNYSLFYFNLSCIGISLFLYLATVGSLMYRRKKINFISANVISKAELRILTVGFTICLACSLDVLITFYAIKFFEPNSFAAGVLMAIVQANVAFLNPIIYTRVNSELREAIFRRKDNKQRLFVVRTSQLPTSRQSS